MCADHTVDHLYSAVMRQHIFLHNREPQPGALDGAFRRDATLIKRIENFLPVLRQDAGPRKKLA